MVTVVHIPSWYPVCDSDYSGIFIKEQIEQLGLCGLDHIVLYIDPRVVKDEFSNKGRVKIILKRTFYIPKVHAHTIRIWAKKYLNEILRLIKQNVHIDLIHAHGYIAAFSAQYISESTGIPYLITEHNSNILMDRIRVWQRKPLRSAYNNASKILAVSNALKRSIKRWSDNDVQVVPNFVNTKIFYPRDENQSAESFHFISVGGLDKLKRVLYTLKAFHQLCLVNRIPRLSFIGLGNQEIKLIKYINRNNLKGRVTIMGGLPYDQIAEEMRKADALVTVSKTETFGKVIIEALASGIPVLAAESADPEHIVHSGNGIRIPSDLSTLPESMSKMIEFASTVDRRRIHEEVKAKYGLKVVLAKIINVYKEVLDSDQPSV